MREAGAEGRAAQAVPTAPGTDRRARTQQAELRAENRVHNESQTRGEDEPWAEEEDTEKDAQGH